MIHDCFLSVNFSSDYDVCVCVCRMRQKLSAGVRCVSVTLPAAGGRFTHCPGELLHPDCLIKVYKHVLIN